MKILSRTKHFLLFILIFPVFLISGFYVYYLYKQPNPPNVNHLSNYYPKDLILKMGGNLKLPETRIQHFLNFSPIKKQSVIRIGTFGDSHTFGEEVDETETYPHQLQEIFNQKFPNKKIEILNFGVGGHSFQEQFFLWEKYAKSYELDYILFGPQGFFSEREVTFRTNWGFDNLRHPRARFTLSNKDKLKQVSQKGETLEEKYKNYYKFIPSWTALRYDVKPFQIWEKFFPLLRNNIQNPFYYKKAPHKEAVEINFLLLEKIRNLYNKKILFFTYDGSAFYNYQPIETLYNLQFISLGQRRFYEVFVHESSLGNELTANLYFNALIGKKKFSLQVINCYFEKSNFIKEKFDKDLYAVKSIQITDGNKIISSLRHNASDHYHNKGFYSDQKAKGTKSFIAFFNHSNFLDSPFIPLSIQLKEDMKIYVRLTNKNEIELGSIKLLDSYEKFFVFYEKRIKNHDFLGRFHQLYFVWEEMPFAFKKIIQKPIELFVGNYKLGNLNPYDLYGHNSLKFVPTVKKSFIMMGPFSGKVREKDFPSEFPLYMQYNMNNGESFKSLIPDWKCKKEKQQIHLNLPNFEPV